MKPFPRRVLPALEARNLGKQYFIRTRRERTLLGEVSSLWNGGGDLRPLWAVRRLDLSVRHGECVGVIGPNGAGKTTLLMLLGGLLAPTVGTVRTRGRVSALLRIGSGLYSELTVLENLRLAGSLFGMTRRELADRLDAIVSFAGISEFLYARLGELSSGYQSRVAFAAALHADIEILLIDEVFSVGDAAFSKKCIERMDDLRRLGKTVMLASHDMGLITSYCSRAIYLERGRVVAAGDPKAVTDAYAESRGRDAAPGRRR